MSVSEEHGATVVWMREDSEPFRFHADEYPTLKAAWMHGETFYTGMSIYGDETTIKLGNVVAVTQATVEGIAAWKRDQKDIEADESIGL